MANADDKNRAVSGRALWNEWAEECFANNKAPSVDFSSDMVQEPSFEGFVFPGPADFSGAEFVNKAMFTDAIFHGDVKIDRTIFREDANFNGVDFKKSANFDHARFHKFANFNGAKCDEFSVSGAQITGEANFEGVQFNRSAFAGVKFKHALSRFTGAIFKHVPDFRAATFETPPLFQRVKVDYARFRGPGVWRRWMSCAAGDDDAVKFRRLKQLASDWRDHERELEFFGKELRAKRFYETKSPGAILLSWAYGGLSDFGQSVMRPIVGLISVTGLALVLILVSHSAIWEVTREQFVAALTLSLTDWALLLGADKWDIRGLAFDKLYGPGCRFSLAANLAAYGQSAGSLFLLFLLGLGLRNRFRTGSS